MSNRTYVVTAKWGGTCGICGESFSAGAPIVSGGGPVWNHKDCYMAEQCTGPKGGYHGPKIVDQTRGY
jgi:hypothetical protein